MLEYIYAPPQNRPRSGDAKHILPLTGDATAFGHACVISCMILFISPLQYNSTFSLFITNNPIRINTFANWSIITLSRLSKVNQYLASRQFLINQGYQIRGRIWQDINYNFTESRKSKLGEISFSMVWFHLVKSSVQVPIWWWSKSWSGLLVTKGSCIGFSDIDDSVGQ